MARSPKPCTRNHGDTRVCKQVLGKSPVILAVGGSHRPGDVGEGVEGAGAGQTGDARQAVESLDDEVMREIADADLKVNRTVMARDEAVEFFRKQGEIYKAEIIASIPANEEISLYGQGDFVDLCRGPHVPSTGKLKAFKLMQVSEAWLREWVNPSWDSVSLANRLTMAGFEVEGRAPAAPAFSGVVVGEIVECARHPQADKLSVCSVTTDGKNRMQIVCGASNARAGLRSAVALVGAKLPGEVTIKAARLRDVESNGMLCSARELGLGDDPEGILELPGAMSRRSVR